MMMAPIEAAQLRWFAVRIKRRQTGGIRTITAGGQFEAYRDRQGRTRQRRVKDTGERVFLPEHLLRRAGFEVFLPIKKVMRRKNRFTPRSIWISQPLLADWLFVAWPAHEDRWHELMAMDVVSGVIGAGGRPIEFGHSQMRRLMAQWGGGELSPACMKLLKSRQEFVGGEVARIISGPFDQADVTVVEARGKSVRVVLDMLGKEVEMMVDAHLLEKAETPEC